MVPDPHIETAKHAKKPEAKPASPVEETQESYLDTVKKSLGFAIAGKKATVNLYGKVLEFQRWGLQNRMSLGTRVMNLVSRVQAFIPALDPNSLKEGIDLGVNLQDSALLMQALSYMTEDVVEIVSRSLIGPFKSPAQAKEWIDDMCELEDLFDLAVIVYEMNLKGELLGKLQVSSDKLQTRMNSLLKSSSKS